MKVDKKKAEQQGSTLDTPEAADRPALCRCRPSARPTAEYEVSTLQREEAAETQRAAVPRHPHNGQIIPYVSTQRTIFR